MVISKIELARVALSGVRKQFNATLQQNWFQWPLISLFALASVLHLIYSMLHVTDDSANGNSAVLFSVTLQAATVISVTSLLIVRRHGITDSDEMEIEKSEVQLKELEDQFTLYEDQLRVAIDQSGADPGAFEKLIEAALDDSQIAEKLKAGEKRILQRIVDVLSQLDELTSKIHQVESAVRRWKISNDRISAGFLFAVVCVVSAVMPLWQQIQVKGAYLALASISCVCASSAYAMLGRRRTDEGKFFDDLAHVNSVVGILRQLTGQALSLRK